MIKIKELYQKILDREIERRAKEQGLTVEDLMIMLKEQKTEEMNEQEQEENEKQIARFSNFNYSL